MSYEEALNEGLHVVVVGVVFLSRDGVVTLWSLLDGLVVAAGREHHFLCSLIIFNYRFVNFLSLGLGLAEILGVALVEQTLNAGSVHV